MDSGGNDPVAKFFLTPESLISQSKNEDFGDPDTTTLLPLDSNTLEVICRVSLPGVPLTGSHVQNPHNNYGFDQLLHLYTGTDFGSLYVDIVQCPSHADALKATKHDVATECGHDWEWEDGRRCEGLGNYAVEIEFHKEFERSIKLIWVRWTTVIEIYSKARYEFEGDPEQRLIDVKRLASALDKAMKDHKGTISQVPKVSVGLEQSDILPFREEGRTESIRLTFQPETHLCRRFWVRQLATWTSNASFDVADVSIDSSASSSCKDLLTWKCCSDMARDFPESGITLRCMEIGFAKLTIKLAHKSSLWPTEKTFILH